MSRTPDLVKRLRRTPPAHWDRGLLVEAADEIELLRRRLADAFDSIDDMRGRLAEQAGAYASMNGLRRDHVAVADNFYSCPKSATGCDDSAWSAHECSCGADEHNARLDALIARLTAIGTLP